MTTTNNNNKKKRKLTAKKSTPTNPKKKHSSSSSSINPYYNLVASFEKDKNIPFLTQNTESQLLAKKINQLYPNDTIRVYADGVWDCFHFGHANALKQAKTVFKNCKLIVGICSDQDTHKYKGKTVMTMKERAESVRHCKWVDEVIENAPWILNKQFLKKNNIHFVAHDAVPYVNPTLSQEAQQNNNDDNVKFNLYALDPNDCYYLPKTLKMFLPTERTDGISTSDLINRIVKDYDIFIRRNFKRGYNEHELNVSFFRAKKIKVGDKIKKIKKSVQNKFEDIDHGFKEFMENSSTLATEFLELFHKDGKIARKIYDKLRKSPVNNSSPNTNDNDITSSSSSSSSPH